MLNQPKDTDGQKKFILMKLDSENPEFNISPMNKFPNETK